MATIKRPFAPRLEPFEIPDTAWNEEPHRCLQVNAKWGSHILGVLEALKDRRTWAGTEAEIDSALETVDAIIENFVTLDCETIGGGAMPYIGEIRTFGFVTPPEGWLRCDGQLLEKSVYPDLYAKVLDYFGEDTATHFYIPNMQGRFPIASLDGTPYPLGDIGGAASVTLTIDEIPSHSHTGVVSPNNPVANRAVVASGGVQTVRTAGTSDNTGGGQGHENRPPYIALMFAIYAGI